MSTTEWISVVLFVIVSYFILHGLVLLISRFLKLDRTEREQVLQSQIDKLNITLRDYEREIDDLRNQVRIIVAQYQDIIGKYKELEKSYNEAREESVSLRDQLNNLSSGYVMRDVRPDKILLVLIGEINSGLSLDLASIRAVRTETGMEIQTISDPSPENLKKALDRARMKQDHIYLHMAIKADKEGYQIGNKIVDASWLSSVLGGVIVLVVAGAESDNVGDFLGVIPYVISMSGDIAHRDASIFSRMFWTEIGRGIGPSLALRRALEKSPGTIREQIVSHWNW